MAAVGACIAQHKMTPLIVSFFTPAYAAEAAGLIQSLDAFELQYDVRPLPSAGSWLLNCSMKPAFIRRMREQYPKRSLVWLDADSRVVQRPSLFDSIGGCDLAAHYFRDTQLASGTLWLAPSLESYELVRRWEWHCGRWPDTFDQAALQAEAESMPGLVLGRLPAAYCHMGELTERYYVDVGKVIAHRQMSRDPQCSAAG